MSGRKKSTSITSSTAARSKRSTRRPRGRSQKARIFSFEAGNKKVVFDSDFIGRSTGELVDEMADPLARAIEALEPEPGTGVDVIVVPGEGYVVSRRGVGKSSLLSSVGSLSLPRVTRPSTDELAERMLPEVAVPSPAQATLAQRESQARWGMLEEFGAFTSEELADQRSQAKNRHALANRWRSEGKVFAVELRGRLLYPGFQFDPETFAPEPVVAEVLAALPREEMSEWEVALWWVASDPWLEGRRPVDVMREDPEAVSAAAAGLAEPSPL